MAGKQHESRPGHEIIRKNQVSDESRKKELLNDQIQMKNDLIHQNTQAVASKDEDFVETGVHFYTLSIMNESNKVLQSLYLGKIF